MIELRWLVMIVVAVLLATNGTFPVMITPPPRLFGISAISDAASIKAAVLRTSAVVGRPIDIINIYKAWVWRSDLPLDALTAIRDSGAIPEITWEPWDPYAGRGQRAYSLQGIAGGEFDSYISTWARQAAVWAGPLYLRFAHEMNGTWYPWALGVNENSPEDYVRAYRHVHQIFDDAGAKNVRWIWSPHVMPELDLNALTAAYPGPSQVDVIGIDGYVSASSSISLGWDPPSRVFGALLAAVTSVAPSVPIWINETGCSVAEPIRAACTSAVVDYFKSTSVKAIMWFDLVDGRGIDWRLAPDSGSGAAAKNSLRTW